MDKIKDSMTYLFKEKNWLVKYLIPFGITFVIFLLSLFTSLDSVNNTSSMYSYNSTYRNASTLSLIISCIICLITIPAAVISSWYSYENTQSGIQKRGTELFFSGNFGDKLKKSLKYLLASLIFGLILGVIIFAIIVVFVVATSLLTGGLFSALPVDSSNSSMFAAFGSYSFLICGLFCCLGLFILALSVIAYLIMVPAYLRLIATNTFGEAFKFSENWKLAMKYKADFISILAVSIVGGFIIGIIQFIFGFASGLFFTIPIIAIFISIITSLLTSLITTYYSYFFLPRYMGLVYRDIVNKEPTLSYVSLEEKK